MGVLVQSYPEPGSESRRSLGQRLGGERSSWFPDHPGGPQFIWVLGPAYDAHYLALAESFGCELWTAAERFYRAASPSIDNVRWLGEFVAPE